MSRNDTHDAEAFCADIVRARDFTIYAASLFVPPDKRRALLALAAFNVEVAQVRDHISQPLPGEIRLQWWRDVLTADAASTAHDDAHHDAQANPVAAELLQAIATHDLPVDALVRLIDAHVFDVYDDPMPDMAALEAHCRDTSAALYKLRAQILGGTSDDISRLADHAGIAEGMTETMLALPKHVARRQLYLPADLMNVHGVIAEDIFLNHVSEGLDATLAHLRGEAGAQLETALTILLDVPPAIRVAFLPLVQTKKILKQLETSKPFAPPLPSRLATLWTLWRAANSPPFKAQNKR